MCALAVTVALLVGATAQAQVATPPSRQLPPGETLSLEQVIQRALQVAPEIVQAHSSITTAASGERTAWAAFLPTLSFSSGASLSSSERFDPVENRTVSGSNDSYSAGLSGGLDIFTGGRRGAELRRSRAVSSAAEATLVERRFTVTLNAKRSYFDVAKAGELVVVTEARLKRAEEGLVAAEHRLQVGTGTRSDVLRAQLELTNARNALATARAQQRTGAFALGRMVGAEGPVYAAEYKQQVPRTLALSDEELARLAVDQAPFVTSAEANYESARASATASRAAYLPTLRLSGGYDWNNQNATFDDGRLSWRTSLSLSYPLFNGFAREDNIARNEANARNTSAVLADARRRARADLERVLSALRLAEEQITLTRQAVEVAQEDLRVQEERYRHGMSTILDRITSQVNLMDAERNEIAARYDYEIARAELEALIGRTL